VRIGLPRPRDPLSGAFVEQQKQLLQHLSAPGSGAG
jgi:hypothetical protein